MRRHDHHTTTLLAAGVAALAAAAVWTTARAEGGRPDAVHTVQARSLDADAPVFRGFVDDGPALRPSHPPIALIPPVPIPGPGARVGPPHSDSLLRHDALTGATVEMAALPASDGTGGSGGGYRGPDGGIGGEGGSVATFWDMVEVANTEDFPWRMNCKLVMRFTDQSGGTRYFTASGAMMDAETVITAGHCVYVRSTVFGPDIYDWAEEIWVYPGWDGVGGQFNPPPSTVHNFGFGHGTYYVAGAGYVDDGDRDRDCGLVEITRGVGMLTGWYGWAYGGGCGWIQDQTYHNASFPAEDCPIDGLHNGSDMYYWSGTIDSCPDNQLQLDTGGGNCFDTAWGGMSGSGMYYIEDDYRRVHAVASTSDRDTWGRYCRLWDTLVTEMTGTFIPDCRGDEFDLQALDVNVEPAVLPAGETFSEADFFPTNPTNGAATGDWTYRVYLSTNDNISAADLLLSTQFYSHDYGAMSSVRVNMIHPTIPPDVPLGDYWIGVILDPATDGSSANNDTDGWDAVPVTVTERCFAPPDFDFDLEPSASWQTASSTTFQSGGCRVYRLEMYPGYGYDFSLCVTDGVGGWADPGDADMTLRDSEGDLVWYIDGYQSCGYDASTLGTIYESWSPPDHGTYYLEVSEYFSSTLSYQLAYRGTSTEHCYAPPGYDVALSPSSAWQTTATQTIDAPGGCRVYRMYLAAALDYDFSVCGDDSVGGWADPGDGDFHMLNAAGNELWYIDGFLACGYDASTLGTFYEAWSPPSDGYYYLLVSDYFDTSMEYRLAYRITPGAAPPNDDCEDATPQSLAPGASIDFTGVNVGATIDSDLFYPEVWHAFTTTECIDLTLAYCDTMPVHGNVYIVLKDSCPAVGPHVYASGHEDVSCGDDNWTVFWNALPPGTYWYPVLTDEGSEGPYVIEASAVSCGGCTGDIDGNGDVGFQDLVQLLSTWGPCPGCAADLNGDDDVGFSDLLMLLSEWGPC